MNRNDEFAFFDFDGLETALFEMGQAGLRFLQDRYRGEHFYVFGFLTRPLRTWPVPIANSEEALARVVQEAIKSGSDAELESAKIQRCWEPTEWPYAPLLYDGFINSPAGEFDGPLIRFIDSLNTTEHQEDSEAFDRFIDAIDEVYYRVLLRLGRSELLAAAAGGGDVLLNLFHYDQSDHERLNHARRVNTPSLLARYEADLFPQELKRLLHLYQRIGSPSWSDRAGMHFAGQTSELALTLFQRAGLKLLATADDETCLKAAERACNSSDPYDRQFFAAVMRMRTAGITLAEINCVIRKMQYYLLCDLYHLLDYPSTDVPEGESVRWRLFQVDSDNKPLKLLDGLATNLYSYFITLTNESSTQADDKTEHLSGTS